MLVQIFLLYVTWLCHCSVLGVFNLLTFNWALMLLYQ